MYKKGFLRSTVSIQKFQQVTFTFSTFILNPGSLWDSLMCWRELYSSKLDPFDHVMFNTFFILAGSVAYLKGADLILWQSVTVVSHASSDM